MVNKRIPCKCRMAERAKPNVFYFCCKWLGAQDTCRDHVARSTHKCESASFKRARQGSREARGSETDRADDCDCSARGGGRHFRCAIHKQVVSANGRVSARNNEVPECSPLVQACGGASGHDNTRIGAEHERTRSDH